MESFLSLRYVKQNNFRGVSSPYPIAVTPNLFRFMFDESDHFSHLQHLHSHWVVPQPYYYFPNVFDSHSSMQFYKHHRSIPVPCGLLRTIFLPFHFDFVCLTSGQSIFPTFINIKADRHLKAFLPSPNIRYPRIDNHPHIFGFHLHCPSAYYF